MNATDVKTFFEAAAAEWDRMRLIYYDERVIETLADAIAIDQTQTVLDVGTGTGFIAAGLAPRADRVIASDTPQRCSMSPATTLPSWASKTSTSTRPTSPSTASRRRGRRRGREHGPSPRPESGRDARRDDPRREARRVGCDHRRRRAPIRMDAHRASRRMAGLHPEQVEGFFGCARLARYATLGSQ
jgi:hypothetical protein